MIKAIDNKTASNNQNTATATVVPTPFADIPTKSDDILPHMTAPAVFDIGEQTAQWLKTFVSANKDHFVDLTGSQPSGECWGRLMPNGYVAIVGSVLSEQMDKAGLAIKLPQFAVWADENGLLQRRKAGGSRYFMNMRFDEAIHRVLVINIDGISTPEDSTGITF